MKNGERKNFILVHCSKTPGYGPVSGSPLIYIAGSGSTMKLMQIQHTGDLAMILLRIRLNNRVPVGTTLGRYVPGTVRTYLHIYLLIKDKTS